MDPAHENPTSNAPTNGHAAAESKAPPAPASATSPAAPLPPRKNHARLFIVLAVVAIVLIAGGIWYADSLSTVSTDDAYVNGHVTLVAPRVAGQVAQVFVEENNRVHKGDLLVQLDTEPYRTAVDIAQSAVDAAQADLTVAQAKARGDVGQMRSLRFALERAIEDVDNQEALLHSRVASLQSAKASMDRAQADYERGVTVANSGSITREELDQRKEALAVAQARMQEALQGVYQVRVSLGLSPKPESGDDLAQVPDDLDQSFSTVRQAQASLIQAAATMGVTDSLTKAPKQMIADFLKRDPQGDIDKIYEQLIKDAPGIKQSQTRLAQVQRNLEQAQLNLKYCSVVSEIDGVVTRREVNPGNNIAAGQAIMAVRSVTEIWIDANFKETQLNSLRIGLPVDIDVDMYGGTHQFKGRISGFTMGTGSSLALLPAENATGNFVKVVQRLPVRIEVLDYDPEKLPLFIGLSATPRVHIKEAPTGPNAGALLQPALTPNSFTETRP